MSERKFYWLKLKKDFFQQYQIKVLKSLPNGRLYALIYLELMAESTSHSGELRFSQMLPYDTVTLSVVIDEDKDNVEKAIETLINLELVEILDDGTIYLNEVQKLIGSVANNDNANRQRKFREKQKALRYDGVTKRNESIEYRDKSIDKKEIDKEKRHKYGEYNNVLLSDEEMGKLKSEFPDWKERIERVSAYCASTGKSYKNYLATIRNWARKDKPVVVDELPTYDAKNNVTMSEEDEKEILELMKG